MVNALQQACAVQGLGSAVGAVMDAVSGQTERQRLAVDSVVQHRALRRR